MAGKRECAGDRLATRSGNLKKHQGGRPEAYFNLPQALKRRTNSTSPEAPFGALRLFRAGKELKSCPSRNRRQPDFFVAAETHLKSQPMQRGNFGGARLYCAGVAGVLLPRQGPWPVILPAASAPEFGRGGTHEEYRDLHSVDHSNTSISPGFAGGGGWSKGGGDTGCSSSGTGAGSGITGDAASSGNRSGIGSDA
jgi:hypothetical protein